MVWNVLTRGTWWTLPLAVSCLAADPAGERFAVAVQNLAAAAGADAQQAAAALNRPGAQAVLAFRPESPRPCCSWASRQPLSAVLFAPPGTALHVAAHRFAPQVTLCASLELADAQYCLPSFVLPGSELESDVNRRQLAVHKGHMCACRWCRRCWWSPRTATTVSLTRPMPKSPAFQHTQPQRRTLSACPQLSSPPSVGYSRVAAPSQRLRSAPEGKRLRMLSPMP